MARYIDINILKQVSKYMYHLLLFTAMQYTLCTQSCVGFVVHLSCRKFWIIQTIKLNSFKYLEFLFFCSSLDPVKLVFVSIC